MATDYLFESAHPGGTYACLVPSTETRENLFAFCTNLGLENVVPVRELHCTVVYSKTECSEIQHEDFNLPCNALVKGYNIFGKDKKVLVLELYCPTATRLHTLFKEKYGASHDFPSYIPHITIASDFTGDIPAELPEFEIEFNGYTVEELT